MTASSVESKSRADLIEPAALCHPFRINARSWFTSVSDICAGRAELRAANVALIAASSFDLSVSASSRSRSNTSLERELAAPLAIKAWSFSATIVSAE